MMGIRWLLRWSAMSSFPALHMVPARDGRGVLTPYVADFDRRIRFQAARVSRRCSAAPRPVGRGTGSWSYSERPAAAGRGLSSSCTLRVDAILLAHVHVA